MEQVTLVDEYGAAIGQSEKMEAHERGLLHLAFSIFLFRNGELLLQKRALSKYHSGGLWANTCCGHPRPGEVVVSAGERRLREELGVSISLTNQFQTRYAVSFENGLNENEFVHMLQGAGPQISELWPDPDEVIETRYADLDTLRYDINAQPDAYSFWLRHYITNHFRNMDAMRSALNKN